MVVRVRRDVADGGEVPPAPFVLVSGAARPLGPWLDPRTGEEVRALPPHAWVELGVLLPPNLQGEAVTFGVREGGEVWRVELPSSFRAP